ncbi:hypothetical protein D9M72_365190 [compost metagenome]
MQLAAVRVALRMRGAARGQAVAEALVPLRRQREGVELEGLVRFLEREQPAAVPEYAGVGRAALAPDHRRVAGRGVAEGAEQRAPGLVLQLPLGRARPAVAVRHLPAVDVKRMHHAVAGEPVVVVVARCVLRARPHAVERAREFRRDRTVDGEGRDVVLLGERGIVAGEEMGVGPGHGGHWGFLVVQRGWGSASCAMARPM